MRVCSEHRMSNAAFLNLYIKLPGRQLITTSPNTEEVLRRYRTHWKQLNRKSVEMALNLRFIVLLIACILVGVSAKDGNGKKNRTRISPDPAPTGLTETGSCCTITKPIPTITAADLLAIISVCVNKLSLNLSGACGGTCIILSAVNTLIGALAVIIGVGGPLLAWLTPTFALCVGSSVSLTLLVSLVLIICCFIVTIINIVIQLILGPCSVVLGNTSLIIIAQLVIIVKCIVVIICALDFAVGTGLTLLIALIDAINVAVVACVNACITLSG